MNDLELIREQAACIMAMNSKWAKTVNDLADEVQRHEQTRKELAEAKAAKVQYVSAGQVAEGQAVYNSDPLSHPDATKVAEEVILKTGELVAGSNWPASALPVATPIIARALNAAMDAVDAEYTATAFGEWKRRAESAEKKLAEARPTQIAADDLKRIWNETSDKAVWNRGIVQWADYAAALNAHFNAERK